MWLSDFALRSDQGNVCRTSKLQGNGNTHRPKRKSRSIYEKGGKPMKQSDWIFRSCLLLTKTDRITRFGLSISSHYTMLARMTIHDSLAYAAVWWSCQLTPSFRVTISQHRTHWSFMRSYGLIRIVSVNAMDARIWRPLRCDDVDLTKLLVMWRSGRQIENTNKIK